MLDRPLAEFIEQLGSAAPTPGGGSVAALTGAQAAALVAMVCHLTIGKKRFAEHEAELLLVLAQAEKLQAELTKLIQADIAAYDQLMAAYRIPKDAPVRAEALAAALIPATETPLLIAEAAAQVLALVPTVVAKGNPHAVSDAAMAAVLAGAAVRSGALNVLINLAANDDADLAAAYRARLAAAEADLAAVESIYATVVARLS